MSKNLVMPDYKNCIANLPNSILKKFGVETVGDTLPLLDKYLEKDYKNIVVFLLDGMGKVIMERHLSEDGAFRTHLKGIYKSTFLSTTVAATTSALSGYAPCEHSWLGWDCYYPQIDKSVTVFLNTISGTEEPAADYNVARTYTPYTDILQRINDAGKKACYVLPFVPPFPDSFDKVCDRVRELCREPEQKYIYAYWNEPDGLLHRNGCGAEVVRNEMIRMEKEISRLAKEQEDTLFIITADHGHIDSDSVVITDYPRICECFERMPSLEPRVLTLFIKNGKEKQFEEEFNKEFGDKFLLMTTEEAFEKKLFGTGTPHKLFRGMLGNYLAIATDNLSIYNDEEIWASMHGSLTEDEMLIPLIVFDSSTMKSIEQLKASLSERLSAKRYEHCLRVARFAKMIAAKTDVDPEKMYIAGLLHDVAKEKSNEEILLLCEKTGKYIPAPEKLNAHQLHGIAGACIAYEEYGIRDQGILMGIAFHSGRVAMQTEEKIVFLADGIDAGYKYGLDPTPIWKQHGLDSAILVMCAMMTRYCVDKNIYLDGRTRDTFDFIIEHLKENSASDDPQNIKLRLDTDEIVDKAMSIYMTHRLRINSVKNIRDMGDYRTESGKMIKKRMLIRSADLSRMTQSDADELKSMGIRHIIDLRTDEEIQKAPDIHTEGFEIHHCPLPTIEEHDEQKRFSEYYKASLSTEEGTWYASEYLRYIDMEQMYRNVIMQPESVIQLRKVIDILLENNEGGVLFHCVSGKDRTGIVAMIIQSALGMKTDEIVNDYYASAIPYYFVTENSALDLEQQGYDTELSEKARELFGVGANMIFRLGKWWSDNQYGTKEEYLTKTLMLSPEKKQRLRDKYLVLEPNSIL